MIKGFVLAVLVTAAGATVADDDTAMQRCRLIADPFSRLKCYDEIPLSFPKPGKEDQSSVVQDATRSGEPAAGRTGTTGAPGPAADPVARFGLQSPRKPSSEPASIESSIVGHFDGWQSNSRIRLSNGQVWEIRDGSQAAYELHDPKVRIVRGVSGTFFMKIEGVSQNPRVRRIE